MTKCTSNHLRGLLLLYKPNIYILPINVGTYNIGVEKN